MTFTIWISLFTICLLGAMSPGPSLAIIVKHSLAGGRLNGIATAWAHATGIAIYALITLIGLSAILYKFPVVFSTVSYAGAAYLAYLGILSIRSKGGIAAQLESSEKVSVLCSAREGFLISLTSPKIMLFFTALFSQFVSIGSDFYSKAIVVTTPYLVDGAWYTFIVLMLSSPIVLNKMREKAMLIDRLSGLVLLCLALRVVWSA